MTARRDFWLAATAGALATLAAVVGSPEAPRAPAPRSVSAIELAEWIRDRRPGLQVLDLRDSAAYAAGHVPTAVLARGESSGRTDGVLVLYADSDARALTAARTRPGALVLRGGADAWDRELLNAELRADSGSPPAARAVDARVAALSRYFGGVPRAASRTATGSSLIMPDSGDAALVRARIRSRGC